METIMGNGSQPMVVGGERHHDAEKLIACGQMHEAVRHNDSCVREHSLHTDNSLERFSLHSIEDINEVKRELMAVRGDLSLKIAEENHRTRDLVRDHEERRMAEGLTTLRAQLIAAGIVPAV